jgi:hypothetical protein
MRWGGCETGAWRMALRAVACRRAAAPDGRELWDVAALQMIDAVKSKNSANAAPEP